MAAKISVTPSGPQRFDARVKFPDGREAAYVIAGDELYVDAHILKWKPVGNLLGLHTAYELDRIAGRYRSVEQERKQLRTVTRSARRSWSTSSTCAASTRGSSRSSTPSTGRRATYR